jgi:hypothetical protein
MASDGSERITEVVTALWVVGELLVVVMAKFASATADEIPALREEAEKLAQRVVEFCIDTAPVDHLPSEEAEALRSELLQLAETLKGRIGDIVEMCWAEIVGGDTSRTRH